jgi:hypothetical protein
MREVFEVDHTIYAVFSLLIYGRCAPLTLRF